MVFSSVFPNVEKNVIDLCEVRLLLWTGYDDVSHMCGMVLVHCVCETDEPKRSCVLDV